MQSSTSRERQVTLQMESVSGLRLPEPCKSIQPGFTRQSPHRSPVGLTQPFATFCAEYTAVRPFPLLKGRSSSVPLRCVNPRSKKDQVLLGTWHKDCASLGDMRSRWCPHLWQAACTDRLTLKYLKLARSSEPLWSQVTFQPDGENAVILYLLLLFLKLSKGFQILSENEHKDSN